MPTVFFPSNVRQEGDDSHSDENPYDPKTPSVNTLDSCDIKPVSLLNIHQRTKVLKKPKTVLLDMGVSYSFVWADSSSLGKIQRQRDTFFSTPNGKFLSNKEFKLESNFTGFSKSKIT